MGFFKKIKKAVKKVAKPVAKVANYASPIGQAQLAAKAVGLPKVAATINQLKNVGQAVVISKVAPVAGPLAIGAVNKLTGSNIAGGQPMAFNLSGLLGATGAALGGVTGANAGGIRALGTVASIASAAIQPKAPAMIAKPLVQAIAPAAVAAGSAVATVGRKFFTRFPNLGTALQKYRNAGMTQVTRGRLYSMLKRFGPELLISGGILTAAAVNELMLAGPGTRRMNPTNVKALRRSVRRLESFHNLCRKVDVLRSRGKSKKCGSRGGSSTFVRQG